MTYTNLTLRALRFVLIVAGLSTPGTAAIAQSADDSVAIFGAVAQRWQEQQPGKRLAIMTAFGPKDGQPWTNPTPADAQRRKARIAAAAGKHFELIDLAPPDATKEARKAWFQVLKTFYKHYFYGPLTISEDRATLEVYEGRPFTDNYDSNQNHIDQLYVRYYLSRTGTGWSVTSVEPIHSMNLSLPDT
jgi:hypothetical protein